MRIFTLFSYLRTRTNLKKSRAQIDRFGANGIASVLKNAKRFPFYANRKFSKFEDLPIISIQEFRNNFEQFNSCGLSLESAQMAAQKSENGEINDLPNGLVAGFSTGTSGQNRGLFLTNEFERADYLGQILGKIFAPSELLKIRKIALCLRAGNSLYNAPKGIEIRFFPLSTQREEIARDIADFAPDILIAPAQIILKIAQYQKTWQNLSKIYFGAEAMNSIECEYVHSQLGIMPNPIYQATEGFLGIGCKNGNLHLNEDNIFFEFEEIMPNVYRPIITDFKRISQSIIRLRLDDIISFKNCDCGQNFKVIENIARTGDIWHLDRPIAPWEIENRIAAIINPKSDWVVIGSKSEIEIHAQNEDDFCAIENCLKDFNLPMKPMEYSRAIDFPKRRHLRWRA